MSIEMGIVYFLVGWDIGWLLYWGYLKIKGEI